MFQTQRERPCQLSQPTPAPSPVCVPCPTCRSCCSQVGTERPWLLHQWPVTTTRPRARAAGAQCPALQELLFQRLGLPSPETEGSSVPPTHLRFAVGIKADKPWLSLREISSSSELQNHSFLALILSPAIKDQNMKAPHL